MEKIVSIIIPIYNGEKFIINTIKSCINQTYKKIELILIDDASKDNSIKQIEKILLEVSLNVKLIKNKKNIGFCNTVNLGINHANGDYILVLGQDDLLENKHIEIMLSELKSSDAFVYCNSNLINENGIKNGLLFNEEANKEYLNNIPKYFTKSNIINSCGLIFKKDFALKANLYPIFKFNPNYGEWLFWLKLIEYGNIKYCNRVKSNYRVHSDNLTATFSKKENIANLENYRYECIKYAYSYFKNDLSKQTKRETRKILRYKKISIIIYKLKEKFFNKEFLKFVIIGIFNTLIGTFFATIYSFFFQANLSFIMGYLTSLFISFIINSLFTFKKKMNLLNSLKYVTAYIPNFIIQNVIVFFVHNILDIHEIISYFIAALIGVPITFLLLKIFVFKK